MKSINYQGAIISTSKKSLRNSAFNLLLLLLIASVIFHYLTRYTDCAFDQENLRVNIKPVYLDPVLNKSLSTPQITHMYEKHGINHHRLPYNQKAPAITVANILTELSYDFDSFTLGLTGKSCYFVKNTNLVLTLAQTVYINRESYKDDCEFNASFDHF
jgi:hypothetical protein